MFKNNNRRTLYLFALISFLAIAASPVRAGNGGGGKMSPLLSSSLSRRNPADELNVWVFFTDKGEFTPGEYSMALEGARARLSERSLRRRGKESGPPVDLEDLPVNGRYVQAVVAQGARMRTTSKWLNAISVRTKVQSIRALASLPFVRRPNGWPLITVRVFLLTLLRRGEARLVFLPIPWIMVLRVRSWHSSMFPKCTTWGIEGTPCCSACSTPVSTAIMKH